MDDPDSTVTPAPKSKPLRPDRRHTPKKRLLGKGALRWALLVTGWSFVISLVFSAASEAVTQGVGMLSSFLILLCFVLLGIVFDILGLAAASVSSKPFHSMASRKVPGAAQALRLIAKADHVSSFCNDVVGDISGIVSGATCTVIATTLVKEYAWHETVTKLLLSALLAGLTVGGKAAGKQFAMANNVQIVHMMGRVVSMIPVFPGRNNGKTDRKEER